MVQLPQQEHPVPAPLGSNSNSMVNHTTSLPLTPSPSSSSSSSVPVFEDQTPPASPASFSHQVNQHYGHQIPVTFGQQPMPMPGFLNHLPLPFPFLGSGGLGPSQPHPIPHFFPGRMPQPLIQGNNNQPIPPPTTLNVIRFNRPLSVEESTALLNILREKKILLEKPEELAKLKHHMNFQILPQQPQRQTVVQPQGRIATPYASSLSTAPIPMSRSSLMPHQRQLGGLRNIQGPVPSPRPYGHVRPNNSVVRLFRGKSVPRVPGLGIRKGPNILKQAKPLSQQNRKDSGRNEICQAVVKCEDQEELARHLPSPVPIQEPQTNPVEPEPFIIERRKVCDDILKCSEIQVDQSMNLRDMLEKEDPGLASLSHFLVKEFKDLIAEAEDLPILYLNLSEDQTGASCLAFRAVFDMKCYSEFKIFVSQDYPADAPVVDFSSLPAGNLSDGAKFMRSQIDDLTFSSFKVDSVLKIWLTICKDAYIEKAFFHAIG